MNLKLEGFRKFGLAGIVCGILLWFIGNNTVTDPTERMIIFAIIGVITLAYIIGNIFQKKLINNGGDEDAKVDIIRSPINPTEPITPL